MLWPKILGILLLPLQLIIMLYRDWKHYDRRTNNYKILTRIQIYIVIFAMLIFSIIMYFDDEAEKALNTTIAVLSDQLSDLNTNLEPLKKLAENTQETYFVVSDRKERRIEDGSYEISFNLKPVGKKIIPLFKIQCKTQNNVKIENITIEGLTVPTMSDVRKSNDQTYISKEYRSMEPGNVKITILTNSIPHGINIAIDPFKKDS